MSGLTRTLQYVKGPGRAARWEKSNVLASPTMARILVGLATLVTLGGCVIVVASENGSNPFTGDGGPAAIAVCHAVPVTARIGQMVTFDGTNSLPSLGASTIVTWTWHFGDAETASGELVSHAYADAGTYTATLEVTDDDNVGGTTVCPLITIE